MQIEISKEDYEFLKDLQHELNTQETDGQAEPKYWGIQDTRIIAVPEGCGDEMIYFDDGDVLSYEDTIKYIDETIKEYSEQQQEDWDELKADNPDIGDIVAFLNQTLGLYTRVVWQREEEYISHLSGCFLTKRACKQYIETNKHNHCNPRTYAMTAFRNYEYGRLLNILKTMKLN